MPYKRSRLHYFTKLFVFAKDQRAQSIDLLQLIINPFDYILSKIENEMTLAVSKCLEPLCRQLLCKIWAIRKDGKNETKMQKNIITMCLAY